MKLLTCDIPEDTGYIIPIGDIHWGAPSFHKRGRKKLEGYCEWVKDHPNSRIFLMGDLGDSPSRTTKSTPFDHNINEWKEIREFFEPYKEHIIGTIDGNHENHFINHLGYSPMEGLAAHLGIPYCGWCAVVRIRVGARPPKWHWQTYDLFFHHTTGGGKLASSLNRIMQLQDIVEGCDVYAGGHNHQLVTGVKSVFRRVGTRVQERKVHFVSCGSYLDYEGSYAEMKQLAPGKLGSPRIRLSGLRHRHDVHISI